MSLIMNFLGEIIQVCTFTMFCFITAFIFCTGRNKSGMKFDYVFFSIMCGVVFLVV